MDRESWDVFREVEHFRKEPCLDVGPLEELRLGPAHLHQIEELEILRAEDLQGLHLTRRDFHGVDWAGQGERAGAVQMLKFVRCGGGCHLAFSESWRDTAHDDAQF